MPLKPHAAVHFSLMPITTTRRILTLRMVAASEAPSEAPGLRQDACLAAGDCRPMRCRGEARASAGARDFLGFWGVGWASPVCSCCRYQAAKDCSRLASQLRRWQGEPRAVATACVSRQPDCSAWACAWGCMAGQDGAASSMVWQPRSEQRCRRSNWSWKYSSRHVDRSIASCASRCMPALGSYMCHAAAHALAANVEQLHMKLRGDQQLTCESMEAWVICGAS